MKTYKEFLEAKDWKSLPDDYWVLVQGRKVIKSGKTKPKMTSSKGQELMTVKNAKKNMMEDKTLKDIVKREKESSYSGSNTSKSIRTMTKQIKREKSDDVIIVHLSDDGDSVMRMKKDDPKLKSLLKKGWEYIK
jgi:hypothetical protein